MRKIGINDFAFKFVIVVCLISLIIKLGFSSNYLAILNMSLFEFVIYFLLLVFLYSKGNKFRRILFYFLIFFMSMIYFVQSIYLDESILRKESFYGVDSAYAKFFLGGIMQVEHYLAIFIGICLIFLIPRLIKFSNRKFVVKKWFVCGCVCIFMFFPCFPYSCFDNIFVNLIVQTYERNFATELERSLIQYDISDFETFDIFENSLKNEEFDIEVDDNIDRVLVFVMESVPYEKFISEQEEISNSNNFFYVTKDNGHLYTNYYTNNQDSRTSVMTMLSSVFIPFEAYESFYNWKPFLGYVYSRNNLVDFFNHKGYHTSFVISSVEGTLESEEYQFDEFVKIPEEVFSVEDEDFLCLHLFEFQRGCEDKFMLENVKELVREKEKLFLFQEFVYGHGVVYNDRVGLTNFEYYNEYLMEVYKFLKSENYLENTIILVVSDHGLREMIPRREVSGYNVPMFVWNEKLNFTAKSELVSHLNFKDVLLSYVAMNYSFELPKRSFFVGPTSRSLLGFVSENGSAIVKEYEDFDQLIFVEGSLEVVSEELGFLRFYRENVRGLDVFDFRFEE